MWSSNLFKISCEAQSVWSTTVVWLLKFPYFNYLLHSRNILFPQDFLKRDLSFQLLKSLYSLIMVEASSDHNWPSNILSITYYIGICFLQGSERLFPSRCPSLLDIHLLSTLIPQSPLDLLWRQLVETLREKSWCAILPTSSMTSVRPDWIGKMFHYLSDLELDRTVCERESFKQFLIIFLLS